MKKKRLSPGRFIALGFASLILFGSFLLALPVSHNKGVSITYLDALFTATSAVCVTGLTVVETASSFSAFGKVVIACLIQIGGLGIASVGVGFFLLSGKKVNIRERVLISESLNYPTLKGIVGLLKSVLVITFTVEFVGFLLCFPAFLKQYSFPKALGISAFHAVSAFNNAGFDILGANSLYDYRDDVLLNLTTSGLIILGGIGFFVILDVLHKRSFRKLTLHTKAVLSTSAVLLLVGTFLIKLAEGSSITWLGAFFNSVSARTAGFATYSIGGFSTATLFVMIILMFIGASPGSTGGGVKTTTLFVLVRTLLSASANRETTGFKKKIPGGLIHKTFVILSLAVFVVIGLTTALCLLEPDKSFLALMFEAVSAVATVGDSMGITADLSSASKLLLICAMYIGRLGPLTIATLWVYSPDLKISRAEESLSVG